MRTPLFWILTAILFLVFATEDWALYRPGTRNLNRLNEAIGKSRQQALGSRIPADKLQKVKELIEHNSIDSGAISEGEGYTSQSLGKLTAILKELKIKLLSFTPGETRQEKLFVVSPFEIELRCSYHQLGRLLETIERSRDFIVIREFRLYQVQKETVAKLSVEIYLFKKDPKA